MKLKIKIAGPKVHEVGYRTFLMGEALNLEIERFTAFNRKENGKQTVVATIEGSDKQIAAFKEFAQKNKPELAEVSDTAFLDFDGNVMKIEAFSLLNTNEQLNKGINAILRMDGNIGQMVEKQHRTLEEIEGLREDLTQNTNKRLDGIEICGL